MNRHELLRSLHAALGPRNYLEIGVNTGRSLALSRVPSIGIDPEFKVTSPLRCDVHLVRRTSDDFFAGRNPIGHVRSGPNPLRNLRRGRPLWSWYRGGTVLDLAFIDGLHLFEFALRDFMNVERFAGPGTIIAMDDVLPRNVDEAARDRHTRDWAGDVFKIIGVLTQHRPDLVVLPMNTSPTGVLLVLGADPANTVLHERYQLLVDEWVAPDPQHVPDEVLDRRGAYEPEPFLDSPILPLLRRNRGARRSNDGLRRKLREHAAALGG